MFVLLVPLGPLNGRIRVTRTLLATAALLLVPGSVVAGSTAGGRFLYAALPCVSLAVAVAFWKVWDTRWRPALIPGIGLWCWLLTGFFSSPTVHEYVDTADNVGKLVAAMRREAPHWVNGDRIVILDHPHPGTEPWRWAYCQYLPMLAIPGKQVTVLLTRHPTAARTYRFDQGDLVPCPGQPVRVPRQDDGR